MFKIEEDFNCGISNVSIEVDNIQYLPHDLKRLAELDYDMERSLEALREAVDSQRRQKVLDAAINAIAIDQVKKQ